MTDSQAISYMSKLTGHHFKSLLKGYSIYATYSELLSNKLNELGISSMYENVYILNINISDISNHQAMVRDDKLNQILK